MAEITPERWRRVRAILDEALARPASRRAAFLKEACGADVSLHAEVEALLAADARAASWIEAPVDAFAGALLGEMVDAEMAPAPDGLSGRPVGHYRLLHEVGRGGMGAVYLAERADGQFEQQVALKLVQTGLTSEAVRRRFLQERQILAHLQHPGIARLLDGGVTDDGAPYLVMEYVQGRPLTAYCDDERLSITSRLRLFGKVCEAVQYAHQNLVVHRDLKPSNILVSNTNGASQVKLLDFGIAKLLEDERGETLTQTGLAMTPEYAAPEQVRGEAITTATDVYSLGVVLYELLSGHRPYRLTRLTPGEVERVICETAPPRVSTAAAQTEEVVRRDGASELITAEEVSSARSTQPAALQRRLAGDLDTIVAKALSKEPVQRYATAAQLGQDVKRHLAGLPVEARKATLGYRLRKFVRRHRMGAAATAAFVGLIGGFGTLYIVQVTKERNRAELEAEKSAQVTGFLTGLFEAGDPWTALGDTLTVYDLLDRGVARAEALAEEPLVQAQMLNVLGRVYRRQGEYESAQPLLEQALALRRDALGPSHPDVAESLDHLAGLLRSKGDYAAAEPLIREALAARREMLGEEHLDVASSLNSLATLLEFQGDYDGAEPLFRQALAMRQRLLGDTAFATVTIMNNLALLLHLKGNYDEAETLFRRVVAIDSATLDENHPDRTADLQNLGALLIDVGEYNEAETLLREALEKTRKTLGDEHPDVAAALSWLVRLRRLQGRYQEAEQYSRQAWAINRAKLGETHEYTISDQANVAVLRHLQGHHAEAAAVLRQALEAMREQLGSDHRRIASVMVYLADVLTAQRDYESAERHYREALAMQRGLLQPGHLDIATTLRGLGSLHAARGDCAAADSRFREALELLQRRVPEDHPRLAQLQSDLGACLTRLGRYEEAETHLVKSHTTLSAHDDQSRFTREALERLVTLYEAWGRASKAGEYRSLLAASTETTQSR